MKIKAESRHANDKESDEKQQAEVIHFLKSEWKLQFEKNSRTFLPVIVTTILSLNLIQETNCQFQNRNFEIVQAKCSFARRLVSRKFLDMLADAGPAY